VRSIRVNTEPPYNVLIGRGLLPRLARHSVITKASKVAVVTSPRVSRLHRKALRAAVREDLWIEVPDGELAKDMRTLESLLARFATAGVDRRSCVIAFGGGTIGDLAGLAASLYMRGIPVVQLPTTLLAQVDASVGGKTAVNLPAGKNLVGTFHQPAIVIAETSFLSTLPERDFRSGIFEVIKCGAIAGTSLFAFCEKNVEKILARDRSALEQIITASVRVKADVVSKDPHEAGLRRILNFGHTIGHALEAAGDYRKLLHGEAVALGMMAAAEIGANMNVTPPEVAERLIACILQFGPLPRLQVPVARVTRLLKSDKKSLSGTPTFVLLDRLGSTVFHSDVPKSLVTAAIRSVLA
jgi:3-dehydroquinate synthase